MRSIIIGLQVTLAIGLGLISALNPAQAHPVIFSGGTAITYTTDAHTTDFVAGYSFTHRFSLNYRYVDIRPIKSERGEPVHFLQANALLKRWNFPDSQGNVYVGAAVGDRGHSLYRFDIDWEDRRYYIAAAHEQTYRDTDNSVSAGGDEAWDMSKFRLGYAPYVAESGQLHTWFMLQYSRNSLAPKVDSITPLMRIFYQNVLFEIGSSFRGDAYLTLMTHL